MEKRSKKRAEAQAGVIAPFEVTIEHSDFMYYNWTLALERPVLPFLMYSFVLLAFSSLLGLWPEGRVFALATISPMLLYALWVVMSANGLWRRYPQLQRPRRYRFFEDGYAIDSEEEKTTVPYSDLARVLESRRAFYLVRKDGSADLLPKRHLPDEEALRTLLSAQVGEMTGSSFL